MSLLKLDRVRRGMSGKTKKRNVSHIMVEGGDIDSEGRGREVQGHDIVVMTLLPGTTHPTCDLINRANIACGSMVKWAIFQLEYTELLNRMDPLRQELRAQGEAAVIKKNEASRTHELITRPCSLSSSSPWP